MSEKYWLDKMNENPRYREIWEKIKEQPFHETTEMILDLEAKLAESEKKARTYAKDSSRWSFSRKESFRAKAPFSADILEEAFSPSMELLVGSPGAIRNRA